MCSEKKKRFFNLSQLPFTLEIKILELKKVSWFHVVQCPPFTQHVSETSINLLKRPSLPILPSFQTSSAMASSPRGANLMY